MTFNLEELSDTVKILDMNLRNAFFPGGVFCNLNDSFQSQENGGSVQTCLRLMRDLHATLDSVLTTVREKVDYFMILPDEILSYIIKNACEDAWETGDWRLERREMDRLVVNLSLVSRRFRNAVINTASLWTCIDNRYCLATGFDERIERSKHLPLTLLIDLWYSVGKRQNILSRIMPIKDRCQRLRAVVNANAAEEVPAAEFPAAESLELFFSGCSRTDWNRVFEKWTFPNVTSLLIDDAIPPPGLFPNVTTCTLYYGICLDASNFSYRSLLQMLASIPHLRHLRVNFLGQGISPPINLVPVTLACLSTITLGDELDLSSSRGWPRLGWILASLILPNVEDIHLHVKFTAADRLLVWVDSITFASERLLEVTSLTIDGPFGLSVLTRNVMHTLFALFRNIRRLELKAYGILKALQDLEENLKLNQLCLFIPHELNSTNPVHIERGDLDKLTQYPDAVRIA